MRAHEFVARVSNSWFFDVERSTSEGDFIGANTTDGVRTSEGAGSKKSDLPAC